MAESFLEEIYEDAMLLYRLKKVIELIRAKHVGCVLNELNDLFPCFGNVCNKYAKVNYDEALKLWNSLDENMKNEGDIIALADRLERNFLPEYQKYLLTLGGISVDDGSGIQFLSADSGFLSLYLTDSKLNVYSMIDPMWEAYQQAKELFDPRIRDYYFWEPGLCYLPFQVYLYSEGVARIHIYEEKELSIEYGRKYGVLDWIPTENVEISIGEGLESYIENANGEYKKSYICEMLTFDLSPDIRNILVDEKTIESTNRESSKIFDINYFMNIQNVKNSIKDFDWHIFKKDFIIVAGGPSVDDRIDYLRRMQGKKTIFAVGTILKKLLQNQIVPDAVTVVDREEKTVHQFDDYTEMEIPMFLGHHTYYGVAEKYQGEKYLAFGTLNYKEKEALPDRFRDVPLLPVGGTVTTFAAALAIYYGAESIELIGADFAFPGNVSHASGTLRRTVLKDEQIQMRIKGVNGEMLPTDIKLWYHCRQMEDLIEYNPNVKFYNLSTCGAEIKGTKWVSGS